MLCMLSCLCLGGLTLSKKTLFGQMEVAQSGKVKYKCDLYPFIHVVVSHPWRLGLRLLTDQRLRPWLVDQSEAAFFTAQRLRPRTHLCNELTTIVFGWKCSTNHRQLAEHQLKQAIKRDENKRMMKQHRRRSTNRNSKGPEKCFLGFFKTRRRAQCFVAAAGSFRRKQTCKLKYHPTTMKSSLDSRRYWTLLGIDRDQIPDPGFFTIENREKVNKFAVNSVDNGSQKIRRNAPCWQVQREKEKMRTAKCWRRYALSPSAF